MEKATARLEVKQIDQTDDVFTFTGHLAVFNNIDFGNDRIEPGAFDEWLAQAKNGVDENIPVFWVHRSSEPVGVMPIKDMQIDGKGLFVKGILPKDDTFVSGRVIPQMKIGSVRKMSIGYDATQIGYTEENGKTIRLLQKIKPWEGSLVPLPMNEEARITDMKSVVSFGDLPLADRKKPWDASAAEKRVRAWSGANGEDGLANSGAQSKYQKAFLWFDSENKEKFGSYKLQIADVIDGKLTAVPRGVFAAAGVMRGARGGVNIPESDRAGVIHVLEKYYGKMDIESPFGKSFRLDDLTCIDERTLEGLLRDGACFSKKMAATIVSAIKSAGLRDADTEDLRDGDDAELLAALDNLLNKIGG